MYGSFRYQRRLGYPLLTPSTVAHESLLESLRSSRGSSLVEFPWGRTSDPRGGSPRALGGVFDSSEGYTVFSNGIVLDLPFLRKFFVLGEGLWVLDDGFAFPRQGS